jgi:hypothetical protein
MFLNFLRTAFLLLVLEVLFFIPDVLGSAWAEGKTIAGLSNGSLLGVTLLFFVVAYIAKSLLQRRFSSMLLLDVAMAIVSNAAAAFADTVLFHRQVNIPGLCGATLGLFVMSTSVSKLHIERSAGNEAPRRQKKYFVDVVIWAGILCLLPGVSISKLATQTGVSTAVVVPLVALTAALFSKTGSDLQKQALQKQALQRASGTSQSYIRGVFTQPRYLRGVLGNLASQILLAHVSVEAGITGVSVLRAFFSFGLSSFLSFQAREIVLEGVWGVAALCGFAVFLLSRLM